MSMSSDFNKKGNSASRDIIVYHRFVIPGLFCFVFFNFLLMVILIVIPHRVIPFHDCECFSTVSK